MRQFFFVTLGCTSRFRPADIRTCKTARTAEKHLSCTAAEAESESHVPGGVEKCQRWTKFSNMVVVTAVDIEQILLQLLMPDNTVIQKV